MNAIQGPEGPHLPRARAEAGTQAGFAAPPVDSFRAGSGSDPGAVRKAMEKLRASAPQEPPFLFARRYSIHEIMTDPVKAAAFERDYLRHEADYFARARHPESGLTFDGYALDPATGTPTEARLWSAASKECLDIGICVKALGGNGNAALVVGGGDPARARREAAAILDRKVDSFLRFNEKYPGFGGYLPWFRSGEDVVPTGDWKDRIPGLDNGELLWSTLIAERSLREAGFGETADKYKAYNDLLIGNLGKIFYDEKAGVVRGNVRVLDPSSPDSGYDAEGSTITGEHGVHEGAMMVMAVSLFARGLPEDAQKKIWDGITMKRVEHEHGTTWQGYWGSAHESWSYLTMPLRDLPEYRSLHRLREEIRTQNAAQRGYPGLAASTNEPGGSGYVDGTGIEGVGSQPVPHNDVFAIYGAFPLLLEGAGGPRKEGNYGLAWLCNMLQAPKMQGPFGGGESATNDGTQFSPLKTMDGTLPNVLALCGGLERESAAMLRHYGKYDRFVEIMKGEYEETFGSAPLREPSGFALPSKQVPQGHLPDYAPPLPTGRPEHLDSRLDAEMINDLSSFSHA